MTQIIIWTRSGCPYCTMAKDLLKKKGYIFEERDLASGWTKDDFLKAVPGATTVPQIFINGMHIGGYTDLKALFERLEKTEKKVKTKLNYRKPTYQSFKRSQKKKSKSLKSKNKKSKCKTVKYCTKSKCKSKMTRKKRKTK
jgi:glutaredoxin 3